MERAGCAHPALLHARAKGCSLISEKLAAGGMPGTGKGFDWRANGSKKLRETVVFNAICRELTNHETKSTKLEICLLP
ncbi:MAG: hypothetical protein SOZ63_01070 [Eggerthellaceae bacterium]|nr:hypothetical protein [Eggerthellaceae bacterium]